MNFLDRLVAELATQRFAPPVHTVYNPLVYARAPHDLYWERYGQGEREALFLGMNPGPWGMAQTGVPFGEVSLVRDWLKLTAPVGRPDPEHPARPVEGFQCRRSEVSGARIWGFFRDRFGTPEAFFSRYFVANYCPLMFMEDSGRNRTPDKLPAGEREPLFAACDRALAATLEKMRPKIVVGVGKFAASRASQVAPEGAEVITIPHPSPANPAANQDWGGQVARILQACGLKLR